jgi:hypothetical protein
MLRVLGGRDEGKGGRETEGAVVNEYHIQFLRHLARHGVRFLIVGGQARWLADRSHVTRDLDVWVSIATSDKPALEQHSWRGRESIRRIRLCRSKRPCR